MSDSEFELIGYIDLDDDNELSSQRNGSERDDEKKMKATRVVVEFPPQLASSGSKKTEISHHQTDEKGKDPDKNKLEKVPSSQQSIHSTLSSVTSSFVPVTRLNNSLDIEDDDKSSTNNNESSCRKISLSYRTNKKDFESDSDAKSTVSDSVKSFSTICTSSVPATAQPTDGSSVISGFDILSLNGGSITHSYASAGGSCSSSVISAFDILSLNGTTKHRCQRCSFLNAEDCTICQVCFAALVANPCMDIDEQIALNLQHKEEQNAFKTLLESEKKRKNLPNVSLLEQSHVLTDDIQKYISKLSLGGIEVLSAKALALHVSRFIECFQVFAPNSIIKIDYYFSEKGSVAMSYERIRIHGLGNHIEVYNSIPSAFKGRPKLSTIMEGSTSTMEEEAFKLGWIVATVKLEEEKYHNGGLISRGRSFPLATFDASMRKNKIIQTLTDGLLQVLHDFFYFSDQPERRNDDSFIATVHNGIPSNKRTKIKENTTTTVSSLESLCLSQSSKNTVNEPTETTNGISKKEESTIGKPREMPHDLLLKGALAKIEEAKKEEQIQEMKALLSQSSNRKVSESNSHHPSRSSLNDSDRAFLGALNDSDSGSGSGSECSTYFRF